ncbi:hypothetical protein EPA93_17495 [Ktedonosporobacter rubrisoli]|uniref:Uncharacterized protein n=1 Tax=Ktedonosporobacter rubrisoli TaxID=2509675 RepID=A0A4P6JQI0_KTERU|nr:hypothetical protein [Ktedonosporobacter rubrisoli]QBD77687.1 hypothetical protein EPA93_17495 [Ktedonosporobacter rubrisoli]
MTVHPALRQLLEDDIQETIEAIATPLRRVSPHASEMVHSQLLADTATICESIWLLVQGPEYLSQGLHVFNEYLQRRRKVGFEERELHSMLETCRQILFKLLASSAKDEQATSRQQLENAIAQLDNMIAIQR